MLLVGFVFFLSGFSALIYQLLWQRSLFTIFGVNIESVTVVVSAFLLGLGLGSLLGGALSKRPAVRPLALFGAMELAVGAFGLVSLQLIDTVGAVALGASGVMTFFMSFAVIVLPTLMMGAALPLLVAHLVRRNRNVGGSVGGLYCVNTLGSAVACLAGAILLFPAWGKTGAITCAAGINFVVGAGALLAHWRDRRARTSAAQSSSILESETWSGPSSPLVWSSALALVALAGFVSLSYEILWVRVYFLAMYGTAHAFPLVLFAMLLGIAGGSLLGGRLCRLIDRGARAAPMLASLFLIGNVLAFLAAPAVAMTVSVDALGAADWLSVRIRSLLLVSFAAAVIGATLPIVSHAAIAPDRRSGFKLSHLYVANIAGSVLGTLVTGYLLMDLLSTERIAVLLALSGPVVFLLLAPRFYPTHWIDVRRFAVAGTTAAAIVFTAPVLFDQLHERLQFGDRFRADGPFAHVVEGRSGTVAVTRDGVVFGTGVYDGAYNVDLVHDRNGIHRAFLIAALHPEPRDVLVIGLSSGSWVQILASAPRVEHLTVVEINPGYLELIPQYPAVASILRNPKVEIVIDDGRRWLAHYLDRHFDLIVSNTTFHWRAGVTDLLSVEFLHLIRQHLRPGGVFAYNTTSSNDVQKTGAVTFAGVLRVDNFLAVSDSAIRVDPEAWRQFLLVYRIDGRSVLDPDIPVDAEKLQTLVKWASRRISADQRDGGFALEDRDSILVRTAPNRPVTDENMGVEWTVGDRYRATSTGDRVSSSTAQP
jgi:spermidine synthase